MAKAFNLKIIFLIFFIGNISFVKAGGKHFIFADPCPEEEEISPSRLPSSILDYISINYPGKEIDDIDMYNHQGLVTYMIDFDLEGDHKSDMDMVFDQKGKMLNAFQEENIAISALPSAAMNNLSSLYNGIEIQEVEMKLAWNGQIVYEVELSNHVDVLLDMAGNMVCEED